MFTNLKGVGLLLVTLAVFSVFSMKAPKGSEAMSGMANAAIASFLVEAVHKYILGDVLALEFFQVLGATSGSLGGVAAAITVPLVMGFLLGGIMKMICTSPLSSMALTAMLGLTGLPMGIAAIACVGGSFTNGIIFHKLGFGNKGNVIAVMLEPLTQANIITANPIPIFSSNFIGGGLAGVSAAVFGIVNNAPGTASPIPGLLAPFAFNDPMSVIFALVFAILGGSAAGLLGGWFFSRSFSGSFAGASVDAARTVPEVQAA